MPSVLNVGAGGVPIAPEYAGWEIVTLDLDPAVGADLTMDVRGVGLLEAEQYDVVYASHILEHLAEHELDGVLWGFWQVLKPGGFADVRVPDALGVMRDVVQGGLDLDSVLYQAPVGPIRVGDVLWGWQAEIAHSGAGYFAHRWGFSRDTLGRALQAARFQYIRIGSGGYELRAMAWKRRPEGV